MFFSFPFFHFLAATLISSGNKSQDDLADRSHFTTAKIANQIERDHKIRANRATHIKKGKKVEDSHCGVWMGGGLCRECKGLTLFLTSLKQWEDSVKNGCNKALSKVPNAQIDGAVVSAFTMKMGHPVFNQLEFKYHMGPVGKVDGIEKARSQMFITPDGKSVSIFIIA